MFADMMVVIIESCVRASVVLCAAWILTSMMRRASAATRHFVWSCAIAGAILASALSSFGPRWSVTIPSSIASSPAILTAESPSGGLEGAVPETSIDVPEITVTAPAGSSTPVSASALDPAFVLGLLWAIGTLAVLAYAFSGAVGAWLLRRSATPVHAPWVEEAQTLAEVFEIAGVITIVESKAIAMPMVCGVWHPLIVVPPSASEWSDERRRVVVLHELAHIKRRDCLTQAVAQIVCAVYWFNPIVWLAARRLRVERERACDDFVLAAGEKGADYAAHLLDIAQTVRPSRVPAMAGLAMARPSQLEGRLLAILNPAIRRSSALHTRLASLGVVMVVTLPVGAVEFISGSPHADATNVAMVVPASSITTAETGQPSGSPGAVPPAPRRSVASRPAASPTPSPAPSPVPAPEPSPQVSPEAVVQIDASQIGSVLGETLGHQIGQQVAAALAGQANQATVAGDPKTIEALIGALNDSDPDVREMVVLTLGRMRDPRIVTALLPLLKDSNADVREQAVFALARSGDARAMTAVATMIDDASADVREQAVQLLGRSRNPEALPALLKALKDSSPDVREQAAFALGHLRSADAVDPLIDALKDTSPDVREQAAFGLGQTRNGRAVDPLTAALKDADADVREQAAFALGQIRDPRALASLTAALRDSVADVREQAAFAIGQISGRQ
jgi:HEAT repeat protein/beta-lactamase regulating signal transducer with metallopeptidase domain